MSIWIKLLPYIKIAAAEAWDLFKKRVRADAKALAAEERKQGKDIDGDGGIGSVGGKVALVLIALSLACGCATQNNGKLTTWGWIVSKTYGQIADTPDAPPTPVLPVNPDTPENLPNSSSEMWYFGAKPDGTFRIRWPTSLPVTEDSFCTVNGVRAKFRSWDKDHGARRASYTVAQFQIQGTVTNVLFNGAGVGVAWFSTEDTATRQGRLP